ncbi:MAG TPA: GAF domain-containing protein, partial [Gammaproteobacteria bacterium]|nr:GAF domain-containing protein [Gammaproteobacteria bacterium]
MSTSDGPEQTRPLHRLALFLRSHRDEIVALWVDEVRQLPKAKRARRPVLVDHMPELLEQIAIGAERGLSTGHPQRESISLLTSRHALQRLEHGFDLNRVVAEYSLLRASVFTALRGVPDQLSSGEIRYLDSAIDYAIAQAVTSYTATQQRTLKALDKISLTALESGSLDTLLDRLLHTLADQVPAVDTAAILLREGDCLVSHAVVGLEHGVTAPPYSTPIDGNSFSSMVAKSRRPLLLHDAANEPLVMSSMVGGRPVRALFGVPFIEDGEVVGIAHIGSYTARDFSEQDKRLFEVMCRRASAIIAQSMLRERLEESEAR